ncbi:MAG TPA: hypothetical protein VMF11_15985 [Candidatus Baltobacteraceae bacterium]|nr:hypothetical protein [Candidatus Baltobacteraceae bacterium]
MPFWRSTVAATIAMLALLGAVPLNLDSQLVLQRYDLAMGDLQLPKTMIFDYSVSQLGPTDIEQRHVIYRSGLEVRDETITVDGIPLKPKIVNFSRREDRYAIARLAPRSSTYSMLFLRTVRDGSHLDYRYDVAPLAAAGGFVVTGLVIDGITYLPREIDFATSSGTTQGQGKLLYGKAGKYWVPMLASVQARVDGKDARERIVWGTYRFPPALPASTFVPPRPLPHATLPPI